MIKPRIPQISDEVLAKLAERIKPVVRFSVDYDRLTAVKTSPHGFPFYIRAVNPRTTAFTWDPKPTRRANDIERLDDIITYHTFGAPAIFKPTIAEVLAQIPKKYIDKVVAFETRSEDLGTWNIISENGKNFHLTLTRLYQRQQ